MISQLTLIFSLCTQADTQKHGVEEFKSLKQVRVSDRGYIISVVSCLHVSQTLYLGSRHFFF